MIIGWVGMLGHGKTMCAVRDAVRLARRRKAILTSNILIDPGEGVDFVQLPVGEDGFDLGTLRELIARARTEKRSLVLVLDEVGLLMPARAWAAFPIDLLMLLTQSRKLRLDLIYTSQSIEMVDAQLRRVTQFVKLVRAIPVPNEDRREAGKRPWFFRVTTWPAEGVLKRDRRIAAEWRRYRRRDEALYDTDELVAPPERLLDRSPGRRARPRANLASVGVDVPRSGVTPVAIVPGQLVPADS